MKKKILAIVVAVMVSMLYVPTAAYAAQDSGKGSGDKIKSADELLIVHNNKGKKVKHKKADESNKSGYIFVLKSDTSGKEKKALKETVKEDCDTDEAKVIFKDNIYYADSLDTIEDVADLDTVEYIEPDYTLHTMESSAKKASDVKVNSYTPNDTYYSYNKWAYEQMNVSGVWDEGIFGKGQSSNETPTVAVVDTGIAGWGQASEYKHPDLNYDNMPTALYASGLRYAYDDVGHGTFVTGEIAAIMNNSIGTNGLMPEVKIVPYKALNSKGSCTTSTLISCMNYISNNNSSLGIDVVNMSLGGSGYSSSFQTAINTLTEKGIIVVAAAGNDGATTYNYPASYDNVVSVSATDKNSSKASYSQYNNKVDVAAPGGDSNGYIYSTYPYYCGGNYAGWAGTSMATPYVSALAAMAKSLDSSIDHDKFMELLKTTSTDKGTEGYDTSFGYGIINFLKLYESVTGGVTPEPETTKYTVTFNMNGHGSAISAQTVKEGETASEPAEPTASGYVFGGWYTESSCTNQFDFTTPITKDTTLYAKWTEEASKAITSVTPASSSYTYTGKAIKPSITVKSNGTTIGSGYYTATYSNNTNVGTATITVTGRNGYSGTVTTSFTILPKGTYLRSLTAAKKGFTAKWSKQSSQTTGYILQYSTSSSFSNASTVQISGTSTVSKAVSNLSSKATYYVRIATYKTVNSKTYQSAWSAARSVRTR